MPGGIRTPDTRLRRPLLYPTELLAHFDIIGILPNIKRVMGIEPTYLAWKASVLPLNYTRILLFVFYVTADMNIHQAYETGTSTIEHF